MKRKKSATTAAKEIKKIHRNLYAKHKPKVDEVAGEKEGERERKRDMQTTPRHNKLQLLETTLY